MGGGTSTGPSQAERQLPRSLGAGGVFSIAAGAMISSGIFVLPAIAFSRAGPAVIVAYAIAGLVALLGTLSVVELATGMPKAGGDYFFITRSLGPLVGTISGLLSWFALSAKSAFAVYGLSALLSSLTGLPLLPVSLALVVFFVALNLLGTKSAVVVEIVLVVGLLLILVGFVVLGLPKITEARFSPFLLGNWNSVASTVGLVFVSFGGLIKASSIAGEVKRPARSLPLGIIGAVVAVTALYVACLVVTVGVLKPAEFAASSTPLADAARALVGGWGYSVLAIAASLAFVTTAHAGILSASRYPLALSKDQLLPAFLGKTMGRKSVPVVSLLITGAMVGAASLVSLELLIKAASSIILSSYVLVNLSVLVMRYGKLTGYRPTFRVRLTPGLQIVSIALFVFFIADLGAVGLIVAASLAGVSFFVYFAYGRRRHTGEYALLHVIERVIDRSITGDNLERELRAIVHEKDEVRLDLVDQVLKEALVLNLPNARSPEALFSKVAEALSGPLSLPPSAVESLLWKRERESTTAISEFVAVPHLIVDQPGVFILLCIRVAEGVQFAGPFSSARAVFVLAGSQDQRTLHLQTLAALAQIAMDRSFESEWLSVRKAEQLREVLLLAERRRFG